MMNKWAELTCTVKVNWSDLKYWIIKNKFPNPYSTSFIFQAISMAVQRGNVQCVQGAYGESAFEELDEIF